MAALLWSSWQTVAPLPKISARVLGEWLDGGQAFRWNAEGAGQWLGQWGSHVVRIKSGPGDAVLWQCPKALQQATAAALPAYLSMEKDWAAATDALPWRSDVVLERAIAGFPNLRILRQPFGETLLGFICSATKQIPQIKQMLAALAQRCGHEVAPGFRRLPTWAELGTVSEESLRQCQLGFRARYVYSIARFLAANPGWLEETEVLPYPAARERLCALPGVGEKVADCVLLFGAGRLESFPVDTWIIKTLATRYGLEGWKPSQIAHFGRTHFGSLAGLAQQYLFAWERAVARRELQA